MDIWAKLSVCGQSSECVGLCGRGYECVGVVIDMFSPQTSLGLEYKDCLIEKNEKFHLAGIHTSFSSLRDLTNFYQDHMLLLADTPITLRTCCPPRPKGMPTDARVRVITLQSMGLPTKHVCVCVWVELSNLIIVRNSSVCQIPSSPHQHQHRSSHIQFHMIKHEDLEWVSGAHTGV